MKNIVIYILTSLFLLSGCTDLDVQPTSDITDKNYWKTEEHFDAFMYGMHSRFRTHAWNFFLMGDARSDIFGDQAFGGEASQGMERFPFNTLNIDNPGISNYGGFYTNINQVNLFIKKANETRVLTDNAKAYYLGQAYAMRAYYFFQIYRTWGAAVYSEEPSESFAIGSLDKAATPANEIIEYIKKDIDASINSFGNDYSIKKVKSLWSKPAALMLKAEVYLWSSRQLNGGTTDATKAKEALLDIQKNVSELALQPKYTDVFDYSKKSNSEIIFAIHNQLNEANLLGGSYASNLLPGDLYLRNYYDETGTKINTAVENNFGQIRLQIRTTNYTRFNDKDSRKRAIIKGVYDFVNEKLTLVGTYPKKYSGTMNGSVRVAADDYPIYRYADLLLMLAESKAILGEDPANEINAVRKRAFGDNYDSSVAYPKSLFQYGIIDILIYRLIGVCNRAIDKNINDAILEERFFEFILEGKRWYDLRRFGNEYVFKHTLADPLKPLRLLWPVDKSTITKNPALTQTPGYE